MPAQRSQEKETESINSLASEEEMHDDNDNPPIATQGKCAKGVLEDITKYPFLSLFKFPVVSKSTLHRLHFELSQVLKIKCDDVENVSHINNSNATRVMLPERESSSINEKRAQLIKKQCAQDQLQSSSNDRQFFQGHIFQPYL